jgi:hypothetical protein
MLSAHVGNQGKRKKETDFSFSNLPRARMLAPEGLVPERAGERASSQLYVSPEVSDADRAGEEKMDRDGQEQQKSAASDLCSPTFLGSLFRSCLRV